ncbi:hypothetical protein NL676_037251 [Syzygium grande]|nr:hypothetical protein NL676_037251 [Syzygium grande]
MEVKTKGPDSYTYNAILSALTDAGRRKKVEELMSMMVEAGKLMDFSIQEEQAQNAAINEPLEELDSNSIACSEQIIELCSQSKYKDAMLVFEDSKQQGVVLSKMAYISLMPSVLFSVTLHQRRTCFEENVCGVADKPSEALKTNTVALFKPD